MTPRPRPSTLTPVLIAATAFVAIVTNAHVVSGTRTFTVTTQDGTRHRATLRGAFAANDLAVIRTPDTGLKPARFADSSSQGRARSV